jgi:Protein of unknown function (DUF2599)
VRLAVVAAVAVLSVALVAAPAASADPTYIDHVQWAKWGDMSSLRVYPTATARQASLEPGTDAQAGAAWAEVLTLSPHADIPGMQAQFLCHWHYAELFEPGKISWNLEPWRNEVPEEQMIAAGCNPGGTEEPF